jgi:predicted aminopeptidase
VKSGYNQISMMTQRTPIQSVLDNPAVSESTKKKLGLALEARKFAEEDLKLASTENYTTYVHLDRPYVTYVVNAAHKWKLEHNLWYFPFVGEIPYKGFFNEEDAIEEENELKKKDLDTYRRGVSAYSTLGWFNDPLLSSMLRYKDHDLVNTIIHETVHATLYIKSSADFNERMAVFLGNRGAEMFYLKKEGPASKTLDLIRRENEDDKVFSHFIGAEIDLLQKWYDEQPEGSLNEEKRRERLKSIQTKFAKEIQPRLKSDSYKNFPTIELNNARLMVYKTYLQDLSDFQMLFDIVKGNFSEFLLCGERLRKHREPEEGLKEIIKELQDNKLSTCKLKSYGAAQ